eukprot:scaffold10963_cov84-Skeletonema_marinoi.AAC.2
METQGKIDEEIDTIQNSIRTVDVDEGQVVAEDLAREPHVDDGNERSSNGDETEPLTISTGTANAYAGGNASDEDAQINTETDGEIGAEETEKVTKEQELQSAITQLREELVEKDELIEISHRRKPF